MPVLMKISNLIKEYLGNHASLGPKTMAGISLATDKISFKKGEKIIEEGQPHNYFYFLLEGGVRSYYLGSGVEIVNWFAFENEWFGSIQTFQGILSRDSIKCIEDSRCIRFDIQTFKKLQREDVVISNFLNVLTEECAVFLENRLRQLQHKEAMERYLHIVENEPEYLQRVPLTYLASYLGISRETLSRLRKQIIL